MKTSLLSSLCLLLTTTSFSLINGFVVANSSANTSTRSSSSTTPRKQQKLPLFARLSATSTGNNPKSNVILNQQQSSDETQSDEEKVGTWNPLRLAVLKLKFTELKFTSPLNYEKRPGTYTCASCDSELFTSVGKYDSGSGWPSFWKTASENRIFYKKEWDGRVEVQCAKCKGHLGHVFPDGPMRMDLSDAELASIPEDDLKTSTESNKYTRLPRYCVNGASLRFNESK